MKLSVRRIASLPMTHTKFLVMVFLANLILIGAGFAAIAYTDPPLNWHWNILWMPPLMAAAFVQMIYRDVQEIPYEDGTTLSSFRKPLFIMIGLWVVLAAIAVGVWFDFDRA